MLSSLAHFYEEDLITDVLRRQERQRGDGLLLRRATRHRRAVPRGEALSPAHVPRAAQRHGLSRKPRRCCDDRGRSFRGPQRRPLARARGLEAMDSASAHRLVARLRMRDAAVAPRGGADVPRPLAQIGNGALMDYVGEPGGSRAAAVRGGAPARGGATALRAGPAQHRAVPRLRPRPRRPLAYNILYCEGAVSIIDFAQAVDPRSPGDVYTLLARDVARVCRYFARYGISAEAEALAADLWRRYLSGGL